MNPNRVEGAGGPLPETPSTQGHEDLGSEVGEDLSARPETAPSKQRAPAMQLPTDIPSAAPVNLPVSSDDDDQVSPPPTDKEGGDRIGKQWVDKAKTVVNSTKDDPYAQKNEMSKVKADYIKSRFNKTVRIDGEAA